MRAFAATGANARDMGILACSIGAGSTHADAFRGAVARVVGETSASDHRPVLVDLPG